MDLRIRLMEKQSTIESAIAGKDPAFVTNYVRRVLKNYLTNEQTGSEGIVISNSTESLSDDTARTDRKMLANMVAGECLTELTGGNTDDDDRSLDDKDTLVQPAPDDEEVNKPQKGKRKTEARHLFDTLMAEAGSRIATLTGGRKDGFDTRLDLERALGKIPDNERQVFEALYLENGELLNRPRSYADAEFLTGLSTQNVRTLERKAIEKLRPALSPGFFRRRS